jgi:peptidoglycan/LPS O-acetylase OafA/YrhL
MSWHLVEKPFLALKKKVHPSSASAGHETSMAAAAVSAPTS